MGDFCVAGFHSHLPIHRGDKVIAIICKHNDNPMSNCPCYLQGTLTPICMPVVGYMGDYGNFEYEDDYEEDETTKALKKLSDFDFHDITENLCRMSEYRTEPNECPSFFKEFNEFSHSEEGTRYHIIYEHYDVYNEMASDWSYVRDSIDSFIIPVVKLLNENGYKVVINPFHDFMFCGLYSMMMDSIGLGKREPGIKDELFNSKVRKVFDVQGEVRALYEECSKKEHFYPPFKILWNYTNHDRAWMSLYNAVQIDIEKAKDAIVRFCSFLMHFDNTEYGHFYFSTSAGQSWHHDKRMWEDRLKMLKVYEKIINEKLEKAPEDEEED